MFFGAIYFDRHSGWFDKQVYGPYASASQLEEYQPKSGAAAAAAQGKRVYDTVCGVCHGTDGMGKPGQAPALAGSEWVEYKGIPSSDAHSAGRLERSACRWAARIGTWPWRRWVRRCPMPTSPPC